MGTRSVARTVAVIVLAVPLALAAIQGFVTAKDYFRYKPMIVSIGHYHELDNIKPITKSRDPSTLPLCDSAPLEVKGTDYSGVLRFDLMNPTSKELTIDYVQISNIALCDIKGYGVSGKTMPLADTLVPIEDRSNGIIYLKPPDGVTVFANDGLHLDLYLGRNSPSAGVRIDPHISYSSSIVIKDKKEDEGEPLVSNLNDLIGERYDYIKSRHKWKSIISVSAAVIFLTLMGAVRELLKEKPLSA